MSDDRDETKGARRQPTQLRWMVPRFALAIFSAGGLFEAWLHSGHSEKASAVVATLLALGILRVTSRLQGGQDPARLLRRMQRKANRPPSIGLGVTIGRGAKVFPGAIVEMGADIGAGAVIESGAVVRMGASIAADAVIESGAVVSWGADVKRGARVQAGARVGAGATVGRGAVVPRDLWLKPGADFNGGRDEKTPGSAQTPSPNRAASREAGGSERAPPSAPPAAPIQPPPDPRQVKLDAVFARIDAEIALSPPLVREHLASQTRGLTELRATCKTLLEREISLRAEASPESLARLDAEKETLAGKIASTDDEPVRFSLSQAVSAIEEQKRQRQMLARNADRLDAELTRLFWTLDALGAQLLRMRSAGADASLSSGPDAELTKSVLQLQTEIDAISDALEQVAKDDRAPAREAVMTEPPPGESGSETTIASPENRQRERG